MEGVSVDALMAAYLVFLAEVLGNADALREPDSPTKVKSILVGGSPPMAYVRLTHPVFEANFPERLGTSAIYPVPWVIKVIVDASMRQSPASVHLDPSLGHLLHLPGAVRGRSKGSSTREYAPHSERIPDSPTPSALWDTGRRPTSCRYPAAIMPQPPDWRRRLRVRVPSQCSSSSRGRRARRSASHRRHSSCRSSSESQRPTCPTSCGRASKVSRTRRTATTRPALPAAHRRTHRAPPSRMPRERRTHRMHD